MPLPVTITRARRRRDLVLIGIPIRIISAVRQERPGTGGHGLRPHRRVGAGVLARVPVPVHLLVWARVGAAVGDPDRHIVLEAVFQGVFILPWIVLSLTFAAFYARMVRGNLIESMGRTTSAPLAREGTVREAGHLPARAPRALTPVVTMFGLDLATLLGGALITETVFNLPGSASTRCRRSTTTSPR